MNINEITGLIAKIGREYIDRAFEDSGAVYLLVLSDSFELSAVPFDSEELDGVDETNKLCRCERSAVSYDPTARAYFLDGPTTARIVDKLNAILLRSNNEPLGVAQRLGTVIGARTTDGRKLDAVECSVSYAYKGRNIR